MVINDALILYITNASSVLSSSASGVAEVVPLSWSIRAIPMPNFAYSCNLFSESAFSSIPPFLIRSASLHIATIAFEGYAPCLLVTSSQASRYCWRFAAGSCNVDLHGEVIRALKTWTY